MDQELLNKYLSGNASTEEKKQVIAWVKSDTAHKTKLLSMRKLYDISLWQIEEDRTIRKLAHLLVNRVRPCT